MGDASTGEPRSRKVGLLPLLFLCTGSLVLLAAGPIIVVNSLTSRTIFQELGSRVVVQSVRGLELALRNYLDAARHQATFIAQNAQAGDLPFGNPDKLQEFAAGSMAAAPQITALTISDASGRVVRVERGQFGKVTRELLDGNSHPGLARLDREARERKRPYWGPPVYSPDLGATVLNLHAPFWDGNRYLGFAEIGISTQALSEMALEMSAAPNSRVFVLDGHNRVLAHMFLALQPGSPSAEKPLLTVEELIDPVVQRLETATPLPDLADTEGIELAELKVAGKHYIVLQKAIAGYGDGSLVVGAYSDASAIDALMNSMRRAILIGLGMLAFGLALGLALSRRLTRPIRKSSEAALAIAALDFDRVEPLPPSRIKEIDNLAISFNAMFVGLKSFSRYAPLTLVRRLIRDNRVGAGTEEKSITVMFTDIAEFTSTCEGMSPDEVAAFVNHHLTLVSECIEREGGTIDKYIGDAVMAFWGAPEDIDNASLRAIRAATAIQETIAADNQARSRAGLPPVRVRIGVHCGPLIVGDIGAPNRINYTVIGDVVNVAQRLEGLGKQVDPEAGSIVLFSKSVKDALTDEIRFSEVGRLAVKGKQDGVHVYRLADPRQRSTARAVI